MRTRYLWLILISGFIAIAILPIISSGGTINVGQGQTYVTLEDAVRAANSGDILNFVSDINVTRTSGNITVIDKALTFQLASSNLYTIFVNGTIAFTGSGSRTISFVNNIPFKYDPGPGGSAIFRNSSLIEITGSGFTFADDRPTLEAGTFTGTGINISGSSNTYARWHVNGSGMSIAMDLSGSSNTINIPSSDLKTTASEGKAINLSGNSNTITFDYTRLRGPGGLIWLSPSASGNTINSATYTLPTPTIYNGTSSKTTTTWYFFNSSWSPSGGNQNPTFFVLQSIPIAGNVVISANLSNVTGASGTNQTWYNATLSRNSTGYSGGNIFNNTGNVIFKGLSAEVPVNLSFGDNTFQGSYQQKNLGSVTILNFNPYNSLPTKNFNSTQTTNWSRISDFTAAPNLTFVIEDPTSRALLGNISYNENIDLTTSTISSGLAVFGDNLNIAAAGNSTNLTIANSGLQAFNKSATLTVYPTGFSFSVMRDIKITAITDGGVSTDIFDGAWIDRAGFVDATQTFTVRTNNITLPVLHFTNYTFSRTSGNPLTLTVGTGGDFATLEEALIGVNGIRDNDTLSLLSNIDVTRTIGNLTSADKTFNLTSNGYKIQVNGTISFSGTSKALTHNGSAWYTYSPANGATYVNSSLIEIPGGSNYFNGTMPTLDAGSYTGTGVNITGSSNTLTAMWNISGSGMSAVLNLSGSSNTVTVSGNLSTSAGKALNLIGNSNILTLNSQNLSGPGGRIWIGPTATGNTITDSGYTQPSVYLYNSTVIRPTTVWYFFNSSWSPSGLNKKPTINITQTLPLAGNVSLIAGYSNVTGQSADVVTNTSVVLSDTGLAGGYLFNDTSTLAFHSVSAVVPVNVSFGENTYAGSYRQKYLSSVTILNFNPFNSLSSKSFNATQTTNWSAISDFRAVPNLTFVIDEPATHALLGNISFNENIDLTASGIEDGLAVLGSNLNIATTGNSTNLTMANSGLQAFNKSATLTVYPTAFNITSVANLTIKATTDAGTTTTLYDQGAWLNRAGFVDSAADVTLGTGNITLPVLHFSKFDFSEATFGGGGTGGGSTGDGGGYVSDTNSLDSLPGSQIVTESGPETVNVNAGGNSAVTKVQATGYGLGDLIITAIAQNTLPSSIPPPDTAVYQFVEITPARFTEIQNGAIYFQVSKSWLAEKGYSKYDMAIMRYANNVWTPLPTEIFGEDSSFVYYRSTTTGFSYFAIVYLKGAAAVPAANVTHIPTPAGGSESTPSTVPVQTATKSGMISTTAVPTTKAPGFTGTLTILGVSGALAIGFLTARKK